MMVWTRRGFLNAWIAAPGVRLGRRPDRAVAVRVRLVSGSPWRELEGVWLRLGLGAAERVVARACPGWWPDGASLPDRWEAWVELGWGRVLVAECRPRERVRETGPRRGFAGGEAVAEALRGSSDCRNEFGP